MIVDLEKRFPTEEERFDAYKKFVILSYVLGLGVPLAIAVFAKFLGHTLSELLFIVWILLFIPVKVASCYILIYTLWKSGSVHLVLRMIGKAMLGYLLTVFTGGLAGLVALYLNWSRLKEYKEKNGRFFKDVVNLNIIFPVFFLLFMCAGFMISALLYGPRDGSGQVLLMIIFGLPGFYIYFILTPKYFIEILDREKMAGGSFYNTVRQLIIAQVILLFCIWSVTSHYDNDIISGDANFNDLGHNADFSATGTDGLGDGVPDMDATDLGDIPNMDGVHPDYGAGTEFVHDPGNSFVHDDMGIGGADPFAHASGTGHMDISSHTGMESVHADISFDGTPADSMHDMMGGYFSDVFGGTNMADITYIQQQPHMVFADADKYGNFQICDPSGMPQMTVSNGNIVNSEYMVVGHITTDPVTHAVTYTDVNNMPIFTRDSYGQMFSDDCYIGHVTTSGNVTELRDIHDNLVSVKDAVGGVWRNPKTGMPICQVKPV